MVVDMRRYELSEEDIDELFFELRRLSAKTLINFETTLGKYAGDKIPAEIMNSVFIVFVNILTGMYVKGVAYAKTEGEENE